MAKRPDALAPLLCVSSPFWRGRNLRRFLLVLIPFALANVLTYKMLSGQWFNFHPSSYAPWSLGGSFLFPLDIFQVPAQVLILGVLLGSLIILSILAAQLFGLAPAAIFIACVFWLAHLPIMALFLVAAIFLAAGPPLLKRSRFYSALLGLVPVMTYLFLAVQAVLARTGPAYANSPALSESFLVSAVVDLTSPEAVCVVLPILMLLVFLAGLPYILWRSHFYSLVLAFIPIGAYLAGSVFIFGQPGDYLPAGSLRSAAELVWPEMSSAGQASRQAISSLSPIQQTWLYSPALLAICLALVLLPVLLFATRRSRRPAVALALATTVLALAGLILFYRAVGPETLDYAILKARFEPNSALLWDLPGLQEYKLRLEQYRLASDPSLRLQFKQERVDLLELLRHATETNRIRELEGQIRQLNRQLRYTRQPGRSASLRRVVWRIRNRLMGKFEEHVAAAKRACSIFLKNYPRSRHRPHVLYMKALVQDARLDQERLRRNGNIYVYYHFPSPESRASLEQLLEEFPENILACPGGLRLARLLAREGRFDPALEVLDRSRLVGRRFLVARSTVSSPQTLLGQLGLPSADLIWPEQLPTLLYQIEQLTQLIAANYRDPAYGSEPLRRFLTKDPQRPDYIERIEDIRAEFPDALVADNVSLQAILTRPPHQQLRLLRSAASGFAGRDAGQDALFHLAQLEATLAGADPENNDLRLQASEHFRQFLQSYPQSYQAELAREQLARLSLLASSSQ